jgi:dTDP-4-amino-4,6-dideoxygalactose transaminase
LGDGGAVTTDNEELAAVVRSLANYGSSRKYVFQYQGRNSRLDEVHAAVLNVKLKYLDNDNALRKEAAKKYIDGIKNSAITLPAVDSWTGNVFHIFPIRTKQRDDFQKYLNEKGVQTVIHYPIPPHKQGCYKEWNRLVFPVAEQIHDEELSLPMSPVITVEQVQYVIDVVNRW